MRRLGMLARGWRGAALLAAGTLAVHQVRFALPVGGDAGAHAGGHASLEALLPWLMALLGAAAGGFLSRLARARRGGEAGGEGRPPMLPLWAASSGALLLLHVGHELLEGAVLRGGPGLPGTLGLGGLGALLAAIAVGGLVALALRGARALIARAARRARARIAAPAGAHRLPPPRSVPRRIGAPLARSAAGRAPPALPAVAS